MSVLVRLLRKDLVLLRRAPVLVALLVAYPLLVALLAGLALKGSQDTPRIAVVNLDTPGLTVQAGNERLGVDDYINRLRDEVDVRQMSAADAARALDDGQVHAVLTIPSGFIGSLQSGVQQPRLRLDTNPRAALESEAITQRMQSAVYRFNQGLAARYVDQVVGLSNLIINGGDLGVFGRTVNVIGLVRSDQLLSDLQARAEAEGRPGLAREMDPLRRFITQTRANLGLVHPAAKAISSPILLDVPRASGARAPVTAFGLAAAVLVSVGLAALLLGAAGIATEREDGTLQRLRLSGVPTWRVVAMKTALAAAAGLVIGLLLLGAVAVTTDVTVGRWGWWMLALPLAGAACGALGACLGAAVPDARSALLGGVLVSLPLMFLGLAPGDVGQRIAGVLPFGRAFAMFQDLLAAPSVTGRLAVNLAALAVMTGVLCAASVWALRRHGDA